MTEPIQVNILDTEVDAQTFHDAMLHLTTWAMQPDGRRYVCTCPVYTLMLCREYPRLRDAVQSADMVTADGMPIVWVQRRWGFPQAERVYGPDILLELCRQTADKDCSHFFLGGSPGVVERLAGRLTAQYPTLRIAGTDSPHISDPALTPDSALIERLNAISPNVIWVGLGSPKQDIWMHLNRPYLNAPLMIGVGAAFDFLSGAKQQAPAWMQGRGLEWVFRLVHEPRRLWRRYFVYNPRFIAGVLWQHLTRRA